jgi:hypothetical protein
LTIVDTFAKIDESTIINVVGGPMARIQLALDVSDLEQAIEFYAAMFRTPPAKVAPGYANFAVDDPPLKLVLIEGHGPGGSLNHLGVEVASSEEVLGTAAHLHEEGLVGTREDAATCCYAVQDKVWFDGPDGVAWELYAVLEDVEVPNGRLRVDVDGPSCCATAPAPSGSCCE